MFTAIAALLSCLGVPGLISQDAEDEAMLAEFQKVLTAGKPADAVRILSKLISRFPSSASTVRAQSRFSARVDAPAELKGVDDDLQVVRDYRKRWLGFAPVVYDGLLKNRKLPDASARLDWKPLQGLDAEALTIYMEQGVVLRELGKSGQKSQFDNASNVFANVALSSPPTSEFWWAGKYETLVTLVDRAGPTDAKLAGAGLANLERSHPEFDEGKFGLKDRFVALKARIQAATKDR